jgi:CTP:molybdopterin cytidylyltransferase MocA
MSAPGAPRIAGVVLAAGAASRFGAPKQLAVLDGRPLLQHALDAQADAGLDERVLVLGARAEEVRAAVDPRGARVVVCAGWEEGMAASLRAGLEDLSPGTWAVVTLGDQPRIPAAAVRAVADAALAGAGGAAAVRATYGGTQGHPIALGPAILARVARLRGDVGARPLLAGAAVHELELGALGSPDDVDTPEQLEALRP